MSDFFANPTVQAGAGIVVLGVMIAMAFYLLASFRDYAAEDKEPIDGALANLQEMHRKGDISDEEFRTIQATTHRLTGRSNVDHGSPSGDPPPKT